MPQTRGDSGEGCCAAENVRILPFRKPHSEQRIVQKVTARLQQTYCGCAFDVLIRVLEGPRINFMALQNFPRIATPTTDKV
jgi:predicted adenine nucleotide alpha hydrolase (AANH) superfamily ATPase